MPTACCRSARTATSPNVLAKSLAKRGTEIHAEARVGTLEHTDTGVIVPFETPKGSEKIEVDQVLVSIGRRPVTEDIGAAEAGVRIDRPRLHRGRHRHHADLAAGRLRDRRLRRHPGPGPRRLRRGASSRSTTSSARTRCRSTTARCRGSSTPTPRWPGRADRGAGPGGRLRRRGAQALVRRQRPRDDPRRDRRPGQDRRRRRTARSSASTWSGRGPASCCTRATWR